MVKNIIFDFGNVIARFDQDYICSFYCSEESMKEFERIIFENWAALDAGYVEYDQYAEERIKALPENLKAAGESFFQDWYTHMPLIESTLQLIDTLKARGYRLFLLSNAPKFFADKIDFFSRGVEKLEDMVFSGPIKMAKPDREIYEYAVEKFGVSPGECLFLDDKQENVSAARSCGMNSLVYKGDTEDVKEWLAVFGL